MKSLLVSLILFSLCNNAFCITADLKIKEDLEHQDTTEEIKDCSQHTFPLKAKTILYSLLKSQNIEKAKRHLLYTLDYWAKEFPKNLFDPKTLTDQNENLESLLEMSIKMSSLEMPLAQDYYNKFNQIALDLVNHMKDPFIQRHYTISLNMQKLKMHKYVNFGDYFKALPVLSEGWSYSLVDFLLQKIYIDPAFIKIYNTNLEEIGEYLRSILHELLDDDRLRPMLHALALYSKEHPSDLRFIFFSKPIKKTYTDFKYGKNPTKGTYLDGINYINIIQPLHLKADLKGTLIHECTHQLMDILYENKCNPYNKDDWKKKILLTSITKELEDSIDSMQSLKNKPKVLETLSSVRLSYSTESAHKEYIAQLPQTIAEGLHEDIQTQEILNLMLNYWDTYILPDINAFIKERSHLDSFLLESYSRNLLLEGEYPSLNFAPVQ